MQIKISKKTVSNPDLILRRANYALHVDRRENKKSFVRRLAGIEFPRFHLYVEEAGEDWSFNLHLDQRAPLYKGVKAHSGEYDGAVVEAEGARIERLLGGVGGSAQRPSSVLNNFG